MLRTLYKSLLEIIQSHRPRLALLPGENEFELAARRVQIHQEIADAIAAGDVAAAEAAVRVHATHHARNP
jgi:DNA-binding GntR family transcriptional regulator